MNFATYNFITYEKICQELPNLVLCPIMFHPLIPTPLNRFNLTFTPFILTSHSFFVNVSAVFVLVMCFCATVQSFFALCLRSVKAMTASLAHSTSVNVSVVSSAVYHRCTSHTFWTIHFFITFPLYGYFIAELFYKLL